MEVFVYLAQGDCIVCTGPRHTEITWGKCNQTTALLQQTGLDEMFACLHGHALKANAPSYQFPHET